MSCITGLSASKYALYILDKQLRDHVTVAWDLCKRNNEDLHKGVSSRDIIKTVINLLSTIQFDEIANSSIAVYPHIVEDLIKFSVIYYTSEWIEAESHFEQLESNQTIRNVWNFCLRVMYSDNSLSTREYISSILLMMLRHVSENCCYYATHTPSEAAFGPQTNHMIESVCNDMYFFTFEYFSALQHLLTVCCVANHKKWFLLFLNDGSVDCCIDLYNALLVDPTHMVASVVPNSKWIINSTRQGLIHCIDKLVCTCLYDTKSVEEIGMLSLPSIKMAVTDFIKNLKRNSGMVKAMDNADKSGSKKRKGGTIVDGGYTTSYFIQFYCSLARVVFTHFMEMKLASSSNNRIFGVDRVLQLYAKISYDISQVGQTQTVLGKTTTTAPTFADTRKHYIRLLHMCCGMVISIAAVNDVHLGIDCAFDKPGEVDKKVSKKRKSNSGVDSNNVISNSNSNAMQGKLFLFALNQSDINLNDLGFLLKYKNVVIGVVMKSLQLQGGITHTSLTDDDSDKKVVREVSNCVNPKPSGYVVSVRYYASTLLSAVGESKGKPVAWHQYASNSREHSSGIGADRGMEADEALSSPNGNSIALPNHDSIVKYLNHFRVLMQQSVGLIHKVSHLARSNSGVSADLMRSVILEEIGCFHTILNIDHRPYFVETNERNDKTDRSDKTTKQGATMVGVILRAIGYGESTFSYLNATQYDANISSGTNPILKQNNILYGNSQIYSPFNPGCIVLYVRALVKLFSKLRMMDVVFIELCNLKRSVASGNNTNSDVGCYVNACSEEQIDGIEKYVHSLLLIPSVATTFVEELGLRLFRGQIRLMWQITAGVVTHANTSPEADVNTIESSREYSRSPVGIINITLVSFLSEALLRYSILESISFTKIGSSDGVNSDYALPQYLPSLEILILLMKAIVKHLGSDAQCMTDILQSTVYVTTYDTMVMLITKLLSYTADVEMLSSGRDNWMGKFISWIASNNKLAIEGDIASCINNEWCTLLQAVLCYSDNESRISMVSVLENIRASLWRVVDTTHVTAMASAENFVSMELSLSADGDTRKKKRKNENMDAIVSGDRDFKHKDIESGAILANCYTALYQATRAVFSVGVFLMNCISMDCTASSKETENMLEIRKRADGGYLLISNMLLSALKEFIVHLGAIANHSNATCDVACIDLLKLLLSEGTILWDLPGMKESRYETLDILFRLLVSANFRYKLVCNGIMKCPTGANGGVIADSDSAMVIKLQSNRTLLQMLLDDQSHTAVPPIPHAILCKNALEVIDEQLNLLSKAHPQAVDSVPSESMAMRHKLLLFESFHTLLNTVTKNSALVLEGSSGLLLESILNKYVIGYIVECCCADASSNGNQSCVDISDLLNLSCDIVCCYVKYMSTNKNSDNSTVKFKYSLVSMLRSFLPGTRAESVSSKKPKKQKQKSDADSHADVVVENMSMYMHRMLDINDTALMKPTMTLGMMMVDHVIQFLAEKESENGVVASLLGVVKKILKLYKAVKADSSNVSISRLDYFQGILYTMNNSLCLISKSTSLVVKPSDKSVLSTVNNLWVKVSKIISKQCQLINAGCTDLYPLHTECLRFVDVLTEFSKSIGKLNGCNDICGSLKIDETTFPGVSTSVLSEPSVKSIYALYYCLLNTLSPDWHGKCADNCSTESHVEKTPSSSAVAIANFKQILSISSESKHIASYPVPIIRMIFKRLLVYHSPLSVWLRPTVIKGTLFDLLNFMVTKHMYRFAGDVESGTILCLTIGLELLLEYATSMLLELHSVDHLKYMNQHKNNAELHSVQYYKCRCCENIITFCSDKLRYVAQNIPAMEHKVDKDCQIANRVHSLISNICDIARNLIVSVNSLKYSQLRRSKNSSTAVLESQEKMKDNERIMDSCISKLCHCFMDVITNMTSIYQPWHVVCQGKNNGGTSDDMLSLLTARRLQAEFSNQLVKSLTSVWNVFGHYQGSTSGNSTVGKSSSTSANMLLWSYGVNNIVLVIQKLLRISLDYSMMVTQLQKRVDEKEVETLHSASSFDSVDLMYHMELNESYLRSVSHFIMTTMGGGRDSETYRNVNSITTVLIDSLVGYPLPQNVKDILFPCIFVLFDKLSVSINSQRDQIKKSDSIGKKNRQIIFTNLTTSGQMIMLELQEVYSRDYKYTGHV